MISFQVQYVIMYTEFLFFRICIDLLRIHDNIYMTNFTVIRELHLAEVVVVRSTRLTNGRT